MSEIEVIDNFEGSSIGRRTFRDKHLFVEIRNEPLVARDGFIHDYNRHFVFGLKNTLSEDREVEVFINNPESQKNLGHKGIVFTQKNISDEFYPSQFQSSTDTYKKHYIKLSLSGGESVYLSNTYFRTLKMMEDIFNRLSDNKYCSKIIYGNSLEGRDLGAYIYSLNSAGKDNKVTFLITSGFHPMEADTFASEAIMEYLNSNEGEALLKHFNFAIIPVVNPDGFYYGYNGCNTKGINLYWDFREKDKINAPESYYLWQYILKIRPSVYIDFHSYTYQLERKKASPYIKPDYFYAGRSVKNLVCLINKKLISLHQGQFTSGKITYAPSTLPYKLTNKFNTITYAKYHLHIMDGKCELKNKAKVILKTILGCLIANDFLCREKILLYPNGQIKSNIADIMLRKLVICWEFKIKILIKTILKKN